MYITGAITDRALHKGIDEVDDGAAFRHFIDCSIVVCKGIFNNLEVLVDIAQ